MSSVNVVSAEDLPHVDKPPDRTDAAVEMVGVTNVTAISMCRDLNLKFFAASDRHLRPVGLRQVDDDRCITLLEEGTRRAPRRACIELTNDPSGSRGRPRAHGVHHFNSPHLTTWKSDAGADWVRKTREARAEEASTI